MSLIDDTTGPFLSSISWGRNLYCNIQRFL